MSYANKYTLNISLLICIPFISSFCLIVLARSGESGHLCLVPDFRGNGFSFLPLSIMLAIGLSYIGFIMFRCFPFIYSFLRDFIMKWC
jgi:hypothetical protein